MNLELLTTLTTKVKKWTLADVLRGRGRLSSLFLCLIVMLGGVYGCGPNSKGKNTLKIPGIRGPDVNILGDQMLISMVAENVNIDGGLRLPIPELADSYVEISPDLLSGGTLLAFSFNINDVLDDHFDRLDPLTLPGGRPLPGVAGGSLPAIAFSIPQFLNLGVYIGPKVFGVFVPLNFFNRAEGAIISARFYHPTTRVRLGNISLVGPDDAGENSGFLLLLDLSNAKVRKKLRRMAKRYEHYKMRSR